MFCRRVRGGGGGGVLLMFRVGWWQGGGLIRLYLIWLIWLICCLKMLLLHQIICQIIIKILYASMEFLQNDLTPCMLVGVMMCAQLCEYVLLLLAVAAERQAAVLVMDGDLVSAVWLEVV